jgi:hypothetical protein
MKYSALFFRLAAVGSGAQTSVQATTHAAANFNLAKYDAAEKSAHAWR